MFCTTTNGTNRTRYVSAPSVSGDALPENDSAVIAWLRISGTPTTEASAVPLVIAIVRFSHWPFGTARPPAQTISSAKATSTKLKVTRST